VRILWLFAIAFTAGCGPQIPPSVGHRLAGSAAPPFEALATNMRSVSVPSQYGQTRVTVVDFWASWCALCRRSMPAYQSLYEDRRHDKVLVVGVSLDDTQQAATRFAQAIGAKFPIVMDSNQRLARRYGVYDIPLTFVLDRQGVVRWVGRDPDDAREAAEAVLRGR